jgi:hypothetical protein
MYIGKQKAKEALSKIKGKSGNSSGNSTPKSESELKKIEVLVAIAGTAGTIFGSGIYTVIQFPLLDYYVEIIEEPNSRGIGTFDIILKNLGLTTAKNVSVSIHIPNATFKNIFSTPYLAENFDKDIKSHSNGYAKINILPPNAEIKITILVDTTNSPETQVITPFVFSDEGTGRFKQWATIIFYSGLLIVLIYLFLTLYRQQQARKYVKNIDIVKAMIYILAYMGLFILVYILIYNTPKLELPDVSGRIINLGIDIYARIINLGNDVSGRIINLSKTNLTNITGLQPVKALFY